MTIYAFALFVQIHPEWKEGSYGDFPGVTRLLEELCVSGDLHAYGFSMNIEPFNMHTPAPNRCADLYIIPANSLCCLHIYTRFYIF